MQKTNLFFPLITIVILVTFFTLAPGAFCQAKPDLTVHIKCPADAAAGQDLDGSIIVELVNTTNVPAAKIGINIVLSKDMVIPLTAAVYQPNWTEDVMLKDGSETVEKIAGMSTITVPLKGANTIPADTPAGKYYIGVFVDSANSVSETNERNNAAFCQINITNKNAETPVQIQTPAEEQKPDLSIGKIWITPDQLITGKKAELHCSFQNIGTDLTGTWKAVYLVDGVEVYTRNFGDIESGIVEDSTAPWTVSAAGVHRFGCVLDSGNSISESSELNNKALMEFKVGPDNTPPAPKPN